MKSGLHFLSGKYELAYSYSGKDQTISNKNLQFLHRVWLYIVRGVVLLKNNEDEGIKEEERIATNSSFVAAWYCFISQIVVFKLHAYDQTKRSLVAN